MNQRHETEIDFNVIGIGISSEIRLTYEYFPLIPETKDSPEEPAHCQIYCAQRKVDEKWIDANWLIDLLNEQDQMQDLETELLNYID